jgi:transcriptional repressor NrdR
LYEAFFVPIPGFLEVSVRCPFCKEDDDKVVDSRSSGQGFVIRRRRKCRSCGRRFTTYERVEKSPLRVIKKDGSRSDFDRWKVLESMKIACRKRPVSTKRLQEITDEVERELSEQYDREVPTKIIGEKIISHLHDLDHVAYVRFASVYRNFQDITEFVKEIEDITKKVSKGAKTDAKD